MTTIRTMPSTRPTVLTWVPVTGADGRTRMEMRWDVGGTRTARRQIRRAA